MKFELLNSKQHNRNQFDCGVNALNIYLQRTANQDQKKNLSRIYVLTKESQIVGYYSISAHSVLTNDLPANMQLAHYPNAPFLLLGRLAVDLKFQKQGFGDALIFHAFKQTKVLAEKVGILGMIVDAKDEQSACFYEKFGFRRLSASPHRLVLPLSAISSFQ